MRTSLLLATALLLLLSAIAPTSATVANKMHVVTKKTCELVGCPTCGKGEVCWSETPPSRTDARRCIYKQLSYVPASATTRDIKALATERVVQYEERDNTHDGRHAFLFAGDNGVGKSRMAYLLSKALCPAMSDKGDYGSCMLEISCGHFQGMQLSAVRASLVQMLGNHMKQYGKKRAMIVLNDIQYLDQDALIGVFGPLFDGGGYIDNELSQYNFRKALVIATMDMARPGSTHALTPREAEAHIRRRVQKSYGDWLESRVTVIPFFPFDRVLINAAVINFVEDIPCANSRVRELKYSEAVIKTLTDFVEYAPNAHHNGRRVTDVMRAEVEKKVSALIEDSEFKSDQQHEVEMDREEVRLSGPGVGMRMARAWAGFKNVLASVSRKTKIPQYDVKLDVNNRGKVYVRIEKVE